MANGNTGSHTNGVDHDFLAAFLGGEIQRTHWNSAQAEEIPLELDRDKTGHESGNTDPSPTCSNCCGDKVTVTPECATKPPQCQTHEHHCHHKHEAEPPRHASWFDAH